MKINITYGQDKKPNGYILVPLKEETAIDITEEEFKRLRQYLGEDVE